jgi:hypothetical protein
MTLKFEKNCRKAGLDVRVIPLPRELSSSCGLACSYPCDKREAMEEIVRAAKIDVAGFHEIE